MAPILMGFLGRLSCQHQWIAVILYQVICIHGERFESNTALEHTNKISDY